MKISTRGRYALTIMIDLAKNYKNDTYISLKDISEKENISLKYLERIISLLNKADYLDTLRGVNGGYKLKKDPKEYRIGDILRVAEGSLAPVNCINNFCSKKDKCKAYVFWEGLYDEINSYLDTKTLDYFL